MHLPQLKMSFFSLCKLIFRICQIAKNKSINAKIKGNDISIDFISKYSGANNNRIAALNNLKFDNIPKQRIHNFLILNICKYKE